MIHRNPPGSRKLFLTKAKLALKFLFGCNFERSENMKCFARFGIICLI